MREAGEDEKPLMPETDVCPSAGMGLLVSFPDRAQTPSTDR
jgi:hypothetical protein